MTNELLDERIEKLSGRALPLHVAVIMDGNGRWANGRSLNRIDGHRAGIATVRRIVEIAVRLKIGYLTLYTFSSENWNRPVGEVRGLMGLLAETLEKEVPDLIKNGVRLQTIGDVSILPGRNREALQNAINRTAGNKNLTLVLALNYGGRDEIVQGVRRIAEDVKAGRIEPGKITADTIHGSLYTADMPDPDLLIRTSGEYRLSNFLLWQLAYTELWITDVLWPDFSESDFLDALESFMSRERRFGKTSQQILSIGKRIASFVTGGNSK